MRFHRRRLSFVFIALLALLLAGCRAAVAPPSPTAAATATSRPTNTPTPSPTATLTPSPTATPTATFTPTATATPAPQPITSETLKLLKPVSEQPWHGYRGMLQHIAWSRDGKYIVGQFSDHVPRVVVWNAATLEQVAFFPKAIFRQWVPDGRLLLRTGEGEYVLAAPAAHATLEPLNLSCFGGEPLSDLRFSPNGRYLAALVKPRTVLLCEQETQTLQRYEIPRDKRAIHELYFGMFSPDEEWLFLGSWAELPPYAFTIAISLHQKRIYATYPGMLLALSPQGNRVLVNDNTAMKVKVAFTGAALSAFSYGVFRYNAQTQTSDGWIALAADFTSQTQVGVMLAHYNQPYDVQFLVREIGSREVSKTLRLSEVAGGALLALSPDRTHFAIASRDGYLRVWNMEGNLLTEEVVADDANERGDYLPEIALSPNGNLLAKPEGFTALGIYTLPNEQPDFTLPRTPEDGLSLIPFEFDFLSDNLIKTNNHGMSVWNLNTKKTEHTYFTYACKADANVEKLICLSFKKLACRSRKFVALVDGQTQAIVAQLGNGITLRGDAIQPQGKFVALCKIDMDSIMLWQTDPLKRRPNLLLTIGGKPKPACGALTFSADGRYLISSAGGVWDVESGDQTGEFLPPQVATLPGEIGAGPTDFFWAYDPAIHSLTLYRLPDGLIANTITLPEDTLAFRFTSDGMRLIVVQLDRITTWQAVP